MSHEAREKLTAVVSGRLLAGWEIVSVVISALLAEWVVLSFFGRSRWLVVVPIALGLGLMLASHRAYGETAKDLGFRFDNLPAALRILFVPTITVIVVMLLLTWLSGNSLSFRPSRSKLLFLPFWALFQQYALQGYINRRAQVIFGRGFASVLLVALLFALLHLPNPVLTGLTFVGGLLWAAVYQRYPNLLALAFSHSIAAFFASFFMPPSVLNGLRVGFKYFG
ncbi:MAG TPA: CPBP family glutamic-type intramembrane protease [Pyrinomonadaceae bacterium]|nr:CPBP family glutamic-type intramembrane protease [Pyrinomonadaceae bacterium]